MQHAEAVERLADLALEPGRLARLEDDPSPEARALRTHLAGCERCAADLGIWRRTWALAGVVLAEAGSAAAAAAGTFRSVPEELRAPASLRSRTLSLIAAEGRPRIDLPRPSPTTSGSVATAARPARESPPAADLAVPGAGRGAPGPRWTRWVAMAAALAIALGAGSLAWTRTRDLDRAQTENAGLTTTMATLDRVLATPVHWVVTLRTPDGVAGGTVAWSGAEIAVITTAVPSPSGADSYRCWVERDGVRTPIGPMWFSGSTGYWAGPIDGWAALLAPGARIGVSLVPTGGGPATPVLVGTL
jgi:hypothetical protein